MGSARLRMEALGRAKALALQHGKRVIFEEFGSKAGLRIRFADPQKRIRIKEMTELGLSQNRMWTPPHQNGWFPFQFSCKTIQRWYP